MFSWLAITTQQSFSGVPGFQVTVFHSVSVTYILCSYMYDPDSSSVEIIYFELVYFIQQSKLVYRTNLFLLLTMSTTFVPAAGFTSNYFTFPLR